MQPKGIKASFVLSSVFHLNHHGKKKNHVSFIRMAACRSQGCVQAFIRASTLSGRTLAANKRAQSLQSESAGQAKRKKASERNLSPHYAFLMPLSLCPRSSCPTPPLHHFPLGSDKKGVSIGSPFSPRLPGLLQRVFLTSFSVSIYLSLSLPPSPLVCLGHHAESPTAAGLSSPRGKPTSNCV